MIFRFVWPAWALLLVGVVLFGVVGVALWRARREQDGRTVAWVRRGLMVAMVLAIGATPAVVAQSTEVVTNVELYIVVDRTGSMAAEDYNGSEPRLEGVKADVVALTEAFPGARYSIISFDSQASRQLPLTSDGRAVEAWADTLRQEQTWYSAGSAIDRPLEVLRTALESAAETNPQDVRLVYFLSDGENTDGDDSSVDASPDGYTELAQYVDGGAVLGYGTAAGGRMREWTGVEDPNRPHIQDPAGGDAVSHIDEDNLKALARNLGVEYVHRDAPGALTSLADGVDVENITADGRREVNVYRDVYWPFVWALVALLAWEAWDQAGRLRALGRYRVPTA